jgi:hypothetical protein
MRTLLIISFTVLLCHPILCQNWKYACKLSDRIDTTSSAEFSSVTDIFLSYDTICYCQGFKTAQEDSALIYLRVGDRASQYAEHKYAKKGIHLVMTGDIVGFGQKQFNSGYNSITMDSITTLFPQWNPYKPFKKQYLKKGINNYEIEENIEKVMKFEFIEDSLFVTIKKIPYRWKLKDCKISLSSGYQDVLNQSFLLSELKNGISINISNLSSEEINSLNLKIDLNKFKHPNYNWSLYKPRNSVYIEI